MCGVVAFFEDGTTRALGSGLMYMPFSFITARHVIRDGFKIDEQQKQRLANRRSGYEYMRFGTALFQLTNAGKSVFWGVNRTWDPTHFDLAICEAARDDAASSAKDVPYPTAFLEWSLEAPPEGSEVTMLGYPDIHVRADGTHWNTEFKLAAQTGKVINVYPEGRDRGMYPWPCFEVDKPVLAGMSGGPVICDGRLCGVVCGDSFGGSGAIVTTLWPITLMEYKYPDFGETLGQTEHFSSKLNSGLVKAIDWSSVRPRRSQTTDADGKVRFRLIDDGAVE